MISRFPLLPALLTILVGLGMAKPVQAKLRVYSTLPSFAEIAARVGGDEVSSFALTDESQNPHTVEPKSDLISRLKTADLLLVSGLDLEIGWLPPSLIESRNKKIQLGSDGYLDVSTVVTLQGLPGGKVDLTRGDTHPAGNPHYLMDPRNGLLIAEAVAGRLAKLEPLKADEFKKRAVEFETQLKAKIARWEAVLKPYAGRAVVSYHEDWIYFTSWAGLKETGSIETRPGVQPTPEGVGKLITLMKEQHARIILMTPYDPDRLAREIARKTKATLIVARTEPGVSSVPKTYIGVFDELVGKIAKVGTVVSSRDQNQKRQQKPNQKRKQSGEQKPESQPNQKPAPEQAPEPDQQSQPNQNSI